VHWSHGSFGYFATYSIGSLYAAQFSAAIQKQQPGLNQMIAAGNTMPVWEWLQKNIYPTGRYFTSEELCRHATGGYLDSKYFLDYAAAKFGSVYSF
jgi:carboxypeptidase Taq